tara:strand:+ start:4905 stop:10667 length:5763 start_codon:yes stop_codon:yes gene_type:complete
MDETIIEYKYLKLDNGEYTWDIWPKNNTPINTGQIFPSNVAPLQLTYNIQYDSSGNPFNNLNIKIPNDISKNIYIFAPHTEFEDMVLVNNNYNKNENLPLYNKNGDLPSIFNKNISFSNINSITHKNETKYNCTTFDISENKLYTREENSTNFILKPGKWYFAYDSSGAGFSDDPNDIHIAADSQDGFLISSIKIPHIDFLYDIKAVNMQLNNKTFNNIFLTLHNDELINIRDHFSRYFITLGKPNDTQSYLYLYFEFLLWTPENESNVNINNPWFLPENYKGIDDVRIKESPTYYLDSELNESLYSNEGLTQNTPSYKQTVWFANHIATIRDSRPINGNANDICYNTVKLIDNSNNIIADLSKNFMNGIIQDISFINIEINADGTPVYETKSIDNWEALLTCPSGVKLTNLTNGLTVDGSRNILSSYADSSDNSGFSLGIVGGGIYNSIYPGYIFKDICGNVFPNSSNNINFVNYGIQFGIVGGNSIVSSPFTIRYKIRKSTNGHDVFIFINETFVTKINDNGCKLNDIKYWGTPFNQSNLYKEYNTNGLSAKLNDPPIGKTIIMQSIKINYIEDIYRPVGLQNTSFIEDILLNDTEYNEVNGNVMATSNVSLNFTDHEHKQTTVTTTYIGGSGGEGGEVGTDISVNSVNNYPCTISYKMFEDTNITPLYDNSSNMIDEQQSVTSDDLSGVRSLKPFTNPTYEQIEPLNYSYIFDAGLSGKIVLTINDFQFLHGLSEAKDRLEIVSGDLSNNTIIWEKIQHRGEDIVWMHNFKNNGGFYDTTPMNDFNLSKNTKVDTTKAKDAGTFDVSESNIVPAEYTDFVEVSTIKKDEPEARGYWQVEGGSYHRNRETISYMRATEPGLIGGADWQISLNTSPWSSRAYFKHNSSGAHGAAGTPIKRDDKVTNSNNLTEWTIGWVGTGWAYTIFYLITERCTRKTEITTVWSNTYGTHNYSTPGTPVTLFNRDFRNGTNVKMLFNGISSPNVNGADGTDKYGVDEAIGAIEPDPAVLSLVDINGSILPKNKKRALAISKNDSNSTINYKIYTEKRFVRMNYFAIRSSTNSGFEIKVDRTLTPDEIEVLTKKFKDNQKTTFIQKDRGILPSKDIYNLELSGNQIESICNEIEPNGIFKNSNNYVNNNNEVPYISLCNYYLRDISNDIILSSHIKKTILDDDLSYQYDDNRNLRELNINPDPRKINPIMDNSNNKIKQKYNYSVKLFNKDRESTLPYIPKILPTSFITQSNIIEFIFSNKTKLVLKQNLLDYWLGDIYKTYIKLYLFIWEPFSDHLGVNGGKTNADILNNQNVDKDHLKTLLNIDFDNLKGDTSGNVTLYTPIDKTSNRFDKLLEINFDTTKFFYGKHSIGFPNDNFTYLIDKFKGQYIFNWTYMVFQEDGVYKKITPFKILEINANMSQYDISPQIFDTSKFAKDDFIYDTNAPNISWDAMEESFTIKINDDEKKEFQNFLIREQTEMRLKNNNNVDISCVEIGFYLWTPNNCKYDKILGEDLSSNSGWVLPNDYYGIQDPRIKLTPYKSSGLSWNPQFKSTTIDPSNVTHYGYNFDLSGTLTKKFTFKKKEGIAFDISNSISDISFNDIVWDISRGIINYDENKYGIGVSGIPNTLDYIKIDETTNVEYSIPYLTRWFYTVWDTSNQKIESRVIKLTGDFGGEESFTIDFKLDRNYYFELNTTGMEGATPFNTLLKESIDTGLTFGYGVNTDYLLIKVDSVIYKLNVEEPPLNYKFLQLDGYGDILKVNDVPVNIIDNSIKNATYGIGIRINGIDITLNSTGSGLPTYSLYIRQSTEQEKVFYDSLHKHKIVKMEDTDIRNRLSNWEPMRHSQNTSVQSDSNNYYLSDNQYEYGVLFSTNINKVVETVVTTVVKLSGCEKCKPINHSSKEYFNKKLRYSNREKQNRQNASKFKSIC